MDWDHIYRSTPLEDLHWFPGEVDDILRQAVAEGWLGPTGTPPEGSARVVLDIGSGQGTDAIYLAAQGFRVTALDISAAARDVAMAEAARAGVNLTYEVGDALDMPFPDAAFDAAVERGCFHHIRLSARSAYAREVARVLKPGAPYLYRSFCWKSQFRASPEELLTEESVRFVFGPHFEILRFGEYEARGEGGRSTAQMHWGLFRRRA